MRPSATTFALRADSPQRVARAVTDAIAGTDRPAGALVLVSGALASRIDTLAEALSRAGLSAPILLAAAPSVLSDKGELEDTSAAVGLVWSGGQTEMLVLDTSDERRLLTGRRALLDKLSGASATLMFAQSQAFEPDALAAWPELAHGSVIGGGTAPSTPIFAIDAGGRVTRERIAFILFRGGGRMIVGSTSACRPLMPFARVTEVRDGTIFALDGMPALDVLENAASDLEDQPLLLVGIESPSAPNEGPPGMLVRSIHGIDPNRRSVMTSREVLEGSRVAFVVRDPKAARADLEQSLRELARECAGAAPRFGVYVNCGGRGSTLYGVEDVDVRAIRARFPDLPFVGLSSAFEFGPTNGKLSFKMYAGVLGVFTLPS